ncbi:MAG: endonuclease domain-containing protein [Patescibacteria group bacterium]|jgi:very-short-patch-repair endonuclease
MSKLIGCGRFLPYDPDLKKRSQENRKNATKEEKKLWYDCLQGIKPQFYRQRIIDHYIADFYCPELKLVIEVDGDSHLSEMGIGNDSVRTSVLEGYGLRIIRFTNKEVTENFEVVKKVIYDLINSRN